MPRQSVAELLRKPFQQLTIDDVASIVSNAVTTGGESLILEWKSDLTPSGLAKAAAAFANTFGGLLIGGVDDETGALVGMAPKSGEAKLWVKEILRYHVTPMLPFDARAIPLDATGDRVVMLIRVDESSTTPHLLTANGAIYVRNPGSSDPTDTVRDQAQLLELTARGKEARERAHRRASIMLEDRGHEGKRLFTLALVPTGCSVNPVRELYTGELEAQILNPAVELFDVAPEGAQVASAPTVWHLDKLVIARMVDRSFTAEPPAFLDGLTVESDGAIQLQRRLLSSFRTSEDDPEPRGPRSLSLEAPVVGMLTWARSAIVAGRQIVSELGGHGELRLALAFGTSGRSVFYAASRAEQATENLHMDYWTTLGGDAHDESLFSELRADILRGIGAPMQALTEPDK